MIPNDRIAQIFLSCLRAGKPVEIDGFGTFHPESAGGFRFMPLDAPRVFIAYATEDVAHAERLYDAFRAAGFNPWMDRRDLQAGQNWPRLIESVLEASDFFVACMSKNSVRKRGGFQSELRFALDIARRMPLDDTFLIPLRFDDCHLPARITREWQYFDLFPDWSEGLSRAIGSIQKQWARRNPV